MSIFSLSKSVEDLQTSALNKFVAYSDELKKSPFSWDYIKDVLTALDFFTCPASTKYHLSFEGGLLVHSVNVVETAARLVDTMGIKVTVKGYQKIILAGLIHDLGKCGFIDLGLTASEWKSSHQPRYIWNDLRHEYVYNDSNPAFSIRDLSGLYAARFQLPMDIQQAVLTHDGAYLEANSDYLHNMAPLTLLIMTADTFAGQLTERRVSVVSDTVID